MKLTKMLLFVLLFSFLNISAGDKKTEKPSADKIIEMLKEGNQRFVDGKSTFPNIEISRRELAANSDQGNYAYATVLSCSDSRVPAEFIFDAGIMDLFVIRVAGNVADTDEIGTIEYGLGHVNTPVLVVLGHSGCGAVKAVNAVVHGEKLQLESNIPPLVDNIIPAVSAVKEKHSDLSQNELVPYAIEQNVWQSVNDLFMKSAASRKLVEDSKVKVIGGIYDIASGKVNWLDENKPMEILKTVNDNPQRSMNIYAE
jgi:carbonic anhydrase